MSHNIEPYGADDLDELATSSELQAVLSAFSPDSSSIADAVSSIKIGLTPSLPSQQLTSRTFDEKVSIHYLSRLPREIIRGLIQKYINHILPGYPCLDASKLWQNLGSVLNLLDSMPADLLAEGIKPNAELYFVYMALAVATNSPGSGGRRDKRRETLARSLFEEGIQHWSRHSAFSSDIIRIQAVLMILQYAFIDPAAASVWMLSGAALRFCIAFGLHSEYSLIFGPHPPGLDLRRRVFWTAYCADRTICAVLQRPLSLRDDAITASFPNDLSEVSLDATSGQSDCHAQLTKFKSWIEYNRIQSEMLEYHLHDRQLPVNVTEAEWMRGIEHRIENWYLQGPAGRDSLDIDKSRALINLHRPSSRVPRPSDESLMKAYQAAISAAKAYKENFRSKLTLNAWQTAHDLLGMSMVVLFCLRHSFTYIRQDVESVALLEDTKLFTINLVSLSEQGWPELLQYAKTYERLLNRLLDPILSLDQVSSPVFTPAEDAELAHLLHLGSSELEKQRNETLTTFSDGNMDFLDLDFTEWIENDALQPDFLFGEM